MLIIYYRIEELVTLHYGNFSILGEWVREFAWRTSCSNWVADQTLQSQLFWMSYEENIWSWSYHPETRMGPVPVGAYAPTYAATMWRKEHQSALPRTTIRDAAKSAPEHALYVDPFRIPWFRNPKGCRTQSTGGVHRVVPSVLPCRQQGWVHEGAAPRTHQAHDQGWPTWSKTGPARPSLRSWRCSLLLFHFTDPFPLSQALGASWPSD